MDLGCTTLNKIFYPKPNIRRWSRVVIHTCITYARELSNARAVASRVRSIHIRLPVEPRPIQLGVVVKFTGLGCGLLHWFEKITKNGGLPVEGLRFP